MSPRDRQDIQAAMKAALPKLDTSAVQAVSTDVSRIQAAVNAAIPKLDTSALQVAMDAALPKLDTSALRAAMDAALPKLDTSALRAAMDAALPKLDTSALQAVSTDVSRIQAAMDAAIREVDWMSIQEAMEATEPEVLDVSAVSGPGPETLHAAVAVVMVCLLLAFLLSELAMPATKAARDTAQTGALALDLFVEMIKRVPGLEGALILIGLLPRTRSSRHRGGLPETDEPSSRSGQERQ